MADILLIEPGYSNKYPPIGLMKISYFHKYLHHDYVRFAKGELPIAYKGKKWDRVYVTTLFTFEWEKTKKAIEYALSVVKDPTQVYTGGILATLMPDLIMENFPTVKNNIGLLNKKGTLGLEHEECIDSMTLDYGMLDDIKDQYVYPAQDAYFTYMTRGCGMKCQFCAVQTLEPEYIPFISITESIRRVDSKFGPKKDLLLMDNNVLKSPYFDKIVDEIKDLGFGKGATYINPKTGKLVQRFVDFNQGLDAFLLTPHKAKRLGELAIRPARIAFDHIEDVEVYKKAIRLCVKYGITQMSNYLLYNGENFTGKGHIYQADAPEDLYNRMKITLDLCKELSQEFNQKVTIFSFPMRYIPLSDLGRGFIGDKWNAKYLRSIQTMLIPTQGKGVASCSFFEADFGKSQDEFIMYLAMPESHLGWRGHFVERKEEAEVESKLRKTLWEENQKYIEEWKWRFVSLEENKREEFIQIIGENKFSVEKYKSIQDDELKELFVHYFTMPTLLRALSQTDGNDKNVLVEYITSKFPLIYKRLIRYVIEKKVPYSLLEGAFRTFDSTFITDILDQIDYTQDEIPFVINSLISLQKKLKIHKFNFEYVQCFFLYKKEDVFSSEKDYNEAVCAIKDLDWEKIQSILHQKFNTFKAHLTERLVENEVGSIYIKQQIEENLRGFYNQLF